MNIVTFSMSRKLFGDVKRYLHLSDNDKTDLSDKLHKIRPFITQINETLIQHVMFSRFLSIDVEMVPYFDEEMVPYFGHHSAKMFIGSKLWI